MRDGSGGRRKKKKTADREVREHSTRYEKYKSDLNRLFDQGMAGELLKTATKDKAIPPEVKQELKESAKRAGAEEKSTLVRRKGNDQTAAKSESRFKLIRAVSEAGDQASLVAALDALVANYGLPDEWEVLRRAIEHPREELVHEAVRKMTALLETTAKISRRASLKERLRSIGQTAADPALRRAAGELEDRL